MARPPPQPQTTVTPRPARRSLPKRRRPPPPNTMPLVDAPDATQPDTFWAPQDQARGPRRGGSFPGAPGLDGSSRALRSSYPDRPVIRGFTKVLGAELAGPRGWACVLKGPAGRALNRSSPLKMDLAKRELDDTEENLAFDSPHRGGGGRFTRVCCAAPEARAGSLDGRHGPRGPGVLTRWSNVDGRATGPQGHIHGPRPRRRAPPAGSGRGAGTRAIH